MIVRGVLSFCVMFLLAGAAWATPPNVIVKAEYREPTTRYDHGILGDAVEWGALYLKVDMCFGCEGVASYREFIIRLPENRVFEDIEPRIVEVIGEGSNEVLVVETDLDKGARLALYSEAGLEAATLFIGRTHRWLAPIGVADLDGDGAVEVAYVDRPHLAKTIRIWRFNYDEPDLALTHVRDIPGFTNHRIGEDNIAGGIRDCGDGPEMIVADANWRNLMAVSYLGGKPTSKVLGSDTSRAAFAKAMDCR